MFSRKLEGSVGKDIAGEDEEDGDHKASGIEESDKR
jgi:hypothetical protein